MALVVKDRVKETTSTTGTGTLTLAGAVAKFQSFSVVGDGNTTYYAIESGNGSDWEVGVGTYTASGTTLSRDTILESSNGGTAISLSGTSTVFCTYPAERSVNTASPHTFTANQTINADLTVDTDTLYVDSTNNRVGIGTSSPATKLHVAGDAIIKQGAGNTAIFSIAGNNNSAGSSAFDFIQGGDNHSYIVNRSNADIRIYTNNAERMRIDSSGNVGIGTSSPLGKLKVNVGNVAPASSGNMNTGVVIESASASRALNIGVNNTAGYSWINAAFANNSGVADNLVLMTGTVERMRIDSSGNVGIGTSSITTLGSGHTTLQINGTTTDKTGALRLRSSNDSVDSALWASTASTYLATISNHPLQFRTNNTERMRIDSSGNVGIGTSSPSTKLHVSGSGTIFKLDGADGVQTNFVFRKEDTRSVTFPEWTIAHTANNEDFHIYGYDGTTFKSLITYDWSASASIFHSGNTTERMRIDSSGNVGIGTTSPSVKLDVTTSTTNNGIRISDGTVSTLFVNSSSSYATLGTSSNHALTFWSNNTERMRITNGGNVGIGTSSPSSISGYTTLTINNGSGAGLIDLQFAGTSRGRLFTSSADAYFYNPTVNALILGTSDTERMRINSAGNITVKKYNGTAASPTESADWPTPVLNLRGYGNFGQESMLSFGYSNDAEYQTGGNVWGFKLSGVASATTSSSSTHLLFVGPGNFNLSCNGDAIFNPGGSERMRITSTGNVGIGTTTPSSTLQVNGTCTATTFVGSLSGNATSADTATRAYEWKGSGSDSNWDTQFQDTEVRSATQIDLNSGTNCPTGGGWWFAESFRHSNPGNYWGLQYAHGWEDRAYQRYIRNVSANSFGSWQLDVGCRAWVNFDGTGTVAIRASGNVSSITDNAQGLYTVNFATAMLDSNYSVTGTAVGNFQGTTGTNGRCAIVAPNLNGTYSTSSFQVITKDSADINIDSSKVGIAVFR